MPNLTLRFK